MCERRSMLLNGTSNEHLMTFNQYKDAKTLFAAIQIRFGGNEATKKTQKTLLKQMYENFSAPSTKSLDSIFNRLQKIFALLSMRTRRFFQKTDRKITINGSDIDGYDKSKVECFNCHKMGHFARECKGPRNQDSRNRNQDSSRRMIKFNKSEFNLATYKRGLAFVEEKLVFYKKNEVIFCEQLDVLKRDISYKDSKISMLKRDLEEDMWKLCLAAAVYYIWQERNLRLFNNDQRDKEVLINTIIEEIKAKMVSITVKNTDNVLQAEEEWKVKFARK
ncbi:ribonuclease H-like domain-containing protein [Tanacetum coccineum]